MSKSISGICYVKSGIIFRYARKINSNTRFIEGNRKTNYYSYSEQIQGLKIVPS